MLGLRLPELLIILVVLVLMFGSKKLPELGDALGKGIRAFKKATEHGFADEDKGAAPKPQEQLKEPAASPPAPADAQEAKPKAGPPA